MSISGPEDTILGTGPPRQNLISLDGIGPKIKDILIKVILSSRKSKIIKENLDNGIFIMIIFRNSTF